MNQPHVRPATRDDVAELARVAAVTFPLACPPDTLPQSVADFVERHLSRGRFADYVDDPARDLLVAEVDGTAVGYTMLVHGDPADADAAAAVVARPTSELSKCYVMPDAHGSGVATLLVEASIEVAAARGARSVWLGCNQQNARANRFYAKIGFEQVGEKRFQVGARLEHDFVRERVLDGGAA
ncbi:GNAT family N-acetyltransferase [Solicola sp. PLA-1-18]|uniref:GNAT family N-acetyltransferase n=1 Tax=Solicola sp. PLA-1-18 TaxID=3380532 RepID=UPI003B7A0F68